MNNYSYIKNFKKSRQKGIGSSDIPILAGLYEKYGSTPLKLFWEKTGRGEREISSEAAEWGHRLEPIILKQFLDVHSSENEKFKLNLLINAIKEKKMSQDSKWQILTEARHPKNTFALAHADMINVSDEPFIVEAKSANFFGAKRKDDHDQGFDKDDLGENGVPAAYYLQIQWQMYVYDIEYTYLPALINTNDFRIYGPIKYNKNVIEKCLALAARFWECIEKDTPPKPRSFEDLTLLYPQRQDKTKVITGQDLIEAREAKERYKYIGKKIKELEDEKEDIKNAIGMLLGENQRLNNPEGDKIATVSIWEEQRMKGLKDIKKADEELYNKIIEKELYSTSKRIRLNL